MSMTSVVTRSPLHALSMNGAPGNINHNNKRKSTRLVFDGGDDDAPPTKKAKGDVATKSASTANSANTAKSATTRPTSNVRTRARKAYEEDDDGFNFSRTRSKRTKATQPVQPPQSRPDPVQQQEQPQEQPPSEDAQSAIAGPATQKKKKPRRTLPVSPDTARVQKEVPRRRSQRLSSDRSQANQLRNNVDPSKHDMAPSVIDKTISTPKQPVEAPPAPEQSPVIENGRQTEGLHVEKKPRLTIPLPFADTPVIRRNKEMRKQGADQSRRSSSGMRGRRASSLIDAGASSGMFSSLICSAARRDVFLSCIVFVWPLARVSRLIVCRSQTGPDVNVEAELENDGRGFRGDRSGVEHGVEDTIEECVFEIGSLGRTTADKNAFTYTAVPHTEVETQELYKHISQNLIEPKRMQQLLMWCGDRALPEKPGGQLDPAETAAMHAGES